MQFADLLSKTLDEDSQDVWENERTLTTVRRFEVRLHAAGLSIRETVAILDLGCRSLARRGLELGTYPV
jgi:hypothetical protein